MGPARQAIEPRTRAQYRADLMQYSASGWERLSFRNRMDEPLDGRTVPGEVVRRFEPARAGLPEISARDACAYIETHQAERPWLAAARGCSPEVQRVFAALDQGSGHGHIRHEGWVTEYMNERRAAYQEDPAQLNPAKRTAGIDGLKGSGKPHICREIATRITDPEAFAVAFARGIEHPKVRAALATPFDRDRRPSVVSVPAEDLLGPEGHRFCTGWRLEPVDGSLRAARQRRELWFAARADNKVSPVTAPTARPVETFEGGQIVFAFAPSGFRDEYEVVSMYPRPPARRS
jgi:hypothetical protein